MIDYHIHGNFCGHAEGELEEYVLERDHYDLERENWTLKKEELEREYNLLKEQCRKFPSRKITATINAASAGRFPGMTGTSLKPLRRPTSRA